MVQFLSRTRHYGYSSVKRDEFCLENRRTDTLTIIIHVILRWFTSRYNVISLGVDLNKMYTCKMFFFFFFFFFFFLFFFLYCVITDNDNAISSPILFCIVLLVGCSLLKDIHY